MDGGTNFPFYHILAGSMGSCSSHQAWEVEGSVALRQYCEIRGTVSPKVKLTSLLSVQLLPIDAVEVRMFPECVSMPAFEWVIRHHLQIKVRLNQLP